MPLEIAIDPRTGDIEVGPDGPVLTDAPTTSLYLAIAIEKGRFHGDPDLGSELRSLIYGIPVASSESALEQAAWRAVQPLVDSGAITIEAIHVNGRHVTIESRQLATPLEVELE